MSRNFIFTFIFLLATISTVYAVPYQPRYLIPKIPTPCPANANTFNLTVSPNPIVHGSSFTFNVSGKLNSEIPTGTLFNAAFFKEHGLFFDLLATFAEDFCASPGISCPISAGTEFSTGIQKTAPDDLPESFVIGTVLISQRDNGVLACAFIKGSATQ